MRLGLGSVVHCTDAPFGVYQEMDGMGTVIDRQEIASR